MVDAVPYGGSIYWMLLALVLFARGMDILSTWVATPNLVLEGNPVAKKLGWTGGIAASIVLGVIVAHWRSSSVIIATMSVLVASRNFQQAWLMRSMGEEAYREWHVLRIQETRASLYMYCLLAQVLLIAILGVALLFSSDMLIPMSMGMGIIGYAIAVTVFTLYSVWRLRRAMG